MRPIAATMLALQIALAAGAQAAEPSVTVELNTAEAAENRCRLTFVIENKGAAAIESLKLELVLFNRDGRVHRRMLAEMGPLRGAKTMVKSFSVDGDCAELRSILVNDVAACVPGDANTCLDSLGLSSRMEAVRLFK